MATYECQNFKDGQVLTAACLNKIEKALEDACNKKVISTSITEKGELIIIFADETELNCGCVASSGTSIKSIEQTTTSTEDDGDNVITITLTNDEIFNFTVQNGSKGGKGDQGASGVHIGTDTPPANANIWINPEGDPTSTENWEFDLDNGTTDTKKVVVVDSDEATANGKLAILRMKDENGNWVEIPALIGSKGDKGDPGVQGKAGISATHKWSGTVLEITSASGTSSADLKGENGVGIASIKQTTTSTADDGNNVFTVTLTNGTTATFTVQNGSKGSKGDTGATGPAYTLTDTDKTNIAATVKASLKTETWTFTLEDGSTVTKAVYVG